MIRRKDFLVGCVCGMVTIIFLLLLAACTRVPADQQKVLDKAFGRRGYQQTSDIEYRNYEDREKLADDPSTIIWCTSAFSNPNAPMFTVPIRQKLTSGNKRPFPTTLTADTTVNGYAVRDLSDAWGMWGTSGEYRFGFTPAHKYWDFYNLETACTDEPKIWQSQKTVIVVESDPTLVNAQNRARDFLRQGKPDEAEKALAEAIRTVQEGVR